MGCKNSKKINKDAEKQKMCKVGLSLGRNNLKVEGNFQIGYHSKTDKKYSNIDGICKINLPQIQEENEEEENEENEEKNEQENEQENERVSNTNLLQS